MLAYRLAPGISIAAGVTHFPFGALRAGWLADIFPLNPVPGTLASIGLIIIVKQACEVVDAASEKGAGPWQPGWHILRHKGSSQPRDPERSPRRKSVLAGGEGSCGPIQP